MSFTPPPTRPPRKDTPPGTWEQELQADILASEIKKAFNWIDDNNYKQKSFFKTFFEDRDVLSAARALIQSGAITFTVDETDESTAIARIGNSPSLKL